MTLNCRKYAGQLAPVSEIFTSEQDAINCCRSALVSSLQSLLEVYPVDEKVAILLSGGVDTCAILEAAIFLKECPRISAAFTVGTSNAVDIIYAKTISIQHNLTHHILDTSLDELLLMLPFCVQTLKCFDGMELRNSIVVAAALLKAKELGYNVCLTGDGSDELLGGYSFSWHTLDSTWSQKRNQLAEQMTFSTPAMAAALHMTVLSPYLTQLFLQWALTTTRDDCVGERYIEKSIGEQKELQLTGKICLREAFPNALSAWRRKDPIEIGSGSSELRTSDFFHQKLNLSDKEFEEMIQQVHQEYSIKIRDREHLWYFKAFLKEYPDLIVPGRSRFEIEYSCKDCQFTLHDMNTLFCNVCGAYPAR